MRTGRNIAITAESIVEDLLDDYPAAAVVFVRRRMHCVGCELARFETVADVCRNHKQPVDQVLADLRLVVHAEAVGS